MEQLNSMFTRLKRTLGAEGSSSQPPEKQWQAAPGLAVSHEEEDGFLVIETHSHCGAAANTHTALTPSPGLGDQQYGSYSPTNLPCPLSPASLPPTPTSPETHSHPTCAHPALEGVPFVLHPSLTVAEHLRQVLASIDTQSAHFDWHKYYYDFDFENAALKDLRLMDSSVACGHSVCDHPTAWER